MERVRKFQNSLRNCCRLPICFLKILNPIRKVGKLPKPLHALDGGFARSGTPAAELTAKELLHDKIQSLKAEKATVYFTSTVAFTPAPYMRLAVVRVLAQLREKTMIYLTITVPFMPAPRCGSQ
jgi:hypothetical protein